MKWKAAGTHAIESGGYIIARYVTLSGDVFGLTHNRVSLGHYLTSNEAKQAAETHRQEQGK